MEYLFFDDGTYIIAIAHIRSVRKNPSTLGTYTVFMDDGSRYELDGESFQRLYNALKNHGLLFGLFQSE